MHSRFRRIAMICGSLALLVGTSIAQNDRPIPEDDLTFRPTVAVSRGTSLGSGTIIASVPGKTLVLTASHVIEEKGAPTVEVHRYNFGVERTKGLLGWPKRLPAKIVARDRAADLAVLEIEGLPAFPYVARIASDADEPDRGTAVLSVGIDRGTKLASWATRVIDHARIDMEKGGGERPFLLTAKFPEFGRSGGGLFLADGTIVGVCVGRAEVIKGRRVGIFGSNTSIHRLLRESGLEGQIARARPKRAADVERTRGAVEPANDRR